MEAQTQPPEDQLERRHWLTLAATATGVLMVVMDSTIVNVALPVIREDLGFLDVSVEELQWVVNAYALSFAVLLLSAGKLADLYGRKRLFIIGLLVFVGASVACGAANEINVLIAFRALQGVGAALIMPTTLSIIQATFPMSKLGMAIGAWSAIVGVGTAIGPLLGGILAEEVDWRWVFYINVPIGLATLITAVVAIRESRGDLADRSIDWGGVFLSAAGLFGLTFGLLKGNDFGWGDPRTLASLAGGVLGLVLFVLYEPTRSAPMLDLSLFRSRTFSGANTVAVLVGFSLFGLLFYGSLMIQGVMGFSATETGLSQLPMMGMIIVMGPIIGRQIGKVGPGPLLTVGMAALVVSFLFFYPLDFGSDFWDLLPGMVIGGFGFATVLTPLTAAALSGVPIHQAGMGAACINSTRQVGGALGLAVMGAISAEVITASLLDGEANPEGFVNGFGWLMVTGAGVSALGALAAWTMIARPARAAARAAAAAAPPPEPEPAPAKTPAPIAAAEPEEVGVEYSRNWALAAPSVVSALPASLAERAARYAGPALEVIVGKATGTRIPIRDEGLVLGRGESGDGALAGDPELSRRHATISADDGRVIVEDLGSTNGTLVNGQAISAPTPAAPGDTIEVGSTTLRVLAQRPRPAPAAGLAVKVVAGPAAGTQILVGAAGVVFGRAETGEGSLGGDPELSRRHASASLLDGGRLLVEDLGSTNGTFVNEHRIGAPTVLRPGDGLRLGTSSLEVVA